MRRYGRACALAIATSVAFAHAGVARADEDLNERVQRLEDAVAVQAEAIARYQEELARYREALQRLNEAEVEGDGGERPPAAVRPYVETRAGQAPLPDPVPDPPPDVAQSPSAATDAPATEAPPEPVGEAPEEELERQLDLAALAEVGGVLTPPGHFVFEPSLEYSHSSVNRFTFRGVEIQEVVLIGVIEASEADRDLWSANIGGRLGLFDGFEVEARVPYIVRDDTLSFLIPVLGQDPLERTTSLSGSGFGDAEVSGRYQLNRGRDGWPVFVSNLRFKSRTGKGPFDVDRDAFGIEEELPTGSGFYEIEPSITAIVRTDPVVLFGNVGYGWRIPDDVNQPVGDFVVRRVNPGDSIKAGVGMAFAINDEFSFSLGYDHNVVLGTKTTLFNPANLRTTTQTSSRLHVGTGRFGMSYSLTDSISVNLDLNVGVTEDAPDMRAVLRLPIRLGRVF